MLILSLSETLAPLSVRGPAGSPAARVLRLTLAAGADGQLGASRAVSLVISPGYVGSVAGGPEVPEICCQLSRHARWRPCAQRGWADGVGAAPRSHRDRRVP